MRLFWIIALSVVAVSIAVGAMTVQSFDNRSAVIVLRTPQPTFEQNGHWTRVSAPAYGHSSDIGYPDISVMRRLIRLPVSGEARVSFHITNMEAIPLHNLPYPLQPPAPKNLPRPDSVVRNEKYYATPSLYPRGVVELKRIGVIRGVPVGMLTVYPFVYEPEKGVLVKRDIEITISFTKPITPLDKRLTSPAFATILGAEVIAPLDIDPFPTVPMVYLIITPPSYTDDLEPFITRLVRRGFDVKVATTLETGVGYDDIMSYISNAYYHWSTAPSFVLFVGDVDVIPTDVISSGYSHYPTDLYYFAIDGGDYLPDMMFGRLSVSSAADLSNAVNKLDTYYDYNFAETDWLSRAAFVSCGTDGDYATAQGTHRYVMNHYIHPPRFSPDSLWATAGVTGSDVISAINDGLFIINYSGHGDTDEWSNPHITVGDVSSFTNSRMFPLMIGNCCLSGKFDEAVCFGEALIRSPHAALTYIGASNSSWWDEDDIWERSFYDARFTEGYSFVFGLLYRGDIGVMESGSSESEYYFQIYSIFGDPALTLYWGVPDTLDVGLGGYDIMPIGESEYIFYPSEDSTIVSISLGDSLIAVGLSVGGEARLVPPVAIDEPGSLFVYGWKRDLWKPWQKKVLFGELAVCTVTPDSIPIGVSSVVSVALTDEGGTPIPDAVVKITGLGVSDSTLTDVSGNASFSITPPYGEVLSIKVFSGGTPVAHKEITVYGGMALSITDIGVYTPLLDLRDSLAPGYEGEITIVASETGFESYAIERDEILANDSTLTDSLSMRVTPLMRGELLAAIAKIGYNIATDTITVRTPTVHISGIVSDDYGSPVSGASVKLYSPGSDTASVEPVISFTSASDGTFSDDEMLVPCGIYDLYASAFGFVSLADSVVLTTSGEMNVILTTGSALTLTVHLSPAVIARVTLIDPDDGALIEDTLSNDEGNVVIAGVPPYSYELVVAARNYKRAVYPLSLSADTVLDITMELATATVLVWDNAGTSSSPSSIHSGLVVSGVSADLVSSIPSLNDMLGYEVVIYSAGNNSSVYDASHFVRLMEYKSIGGRILVEGGDVSYEVTDEGESVYAEDVLHIESWESDDPGGLTALGIDLTQPPYADPDFLPVHLSTATVGWMDFYKFDVLTPSSDAFLLYEADGVAGSGCVILYDDSADNGFRRSILLSADYNTGLTDTDEKRSLVRNAVEYLREPDYSIATLIGEVTIEGGGSLAGIRISTGGDTTTTNTNGQFLVHTIPGSVELDFHRTGLRDTSLTVSVSSGQKLWGIGMYMHLSEAVFSNSPASFAMGSPFPNPTNGVVAIPYHLTKSAPASVRLTDITGKIILQMECRMEKGNGTITIDLSGIPSGLLLCSVRANGRLWNSKLLYIE